MTNNQSAEREYYVLSINHTQRHTPYIILWAPNDSGYRGRIETAGRYTESEITAHLGYYNCGHCAIAVPCDVAEPLAVPVQPGFFDDDNGRWLRNNRATWKVILSNLITDPKYKPRPLFYRKRS